MSKRPVDPSRLAAFRVLRKVSADGAYAHLAIADLLREREVNAAMVTELVHGTCRAWGTYDRIIEAAAGRKLNTLQPAVIDILRLGCHQLLAMRIPTHAAVAATVDVAAVGISPRVSGVVNAVLRKVAVQDFDSWVSQLSVGADPQTRLALQHCHPKWIVKALAEILPADELAPALAANNVAPKPTLVVRPGLLTRDELLDEVEDGHPTPFSPFGVTASGNPQRWASIRDGRAGVQDEGSQLAALVAYRAAKPGPWLDLCAGPGGKTALLAGLVADDFTAAEIQPHRAELIRQAVRGYTHPPTVVVADGTQAWGEGRFTNVVADVPCSGLGALRRRPEARWRKKPSDLNELVELQRHLLAQAIAAVSDGVVTYITCSPHRFETEEVLAAVLKDHRHVTRLDTASYLPEVPDCRAGTSVQLWPHRHGTDAMFIAALRVSDVKGG